MDRDIRDERREEKRKHMCTSVVAFQFRMCMPSPAAMAAPCFCPTATKEGYLPPWVVAKAFTFHTVLQDVAEVQGVQLHDLGGKRVDEYISGKTILKGRGHPRIDCDAAPPL